jgi:hypothetical protein
MRTGIVSIRTSIGRAWAAKSLEGSHLEKIGVPFIVDCEKFELIVPVSHLDSIFSNLAIGLGANREVVDVAMTEYLDNWEGSSACSLIVEDEISLRGDPIRNGPIAYLGDKVFRWCTLGTSGNQGVDLLRAGSSGYPLNAFITTLSPKHLGLWSAADLGPSFVEAVTRSTRAVIVSALDAESFLICQKSGH